MGRTTLKRAGANVAVGELFWGRETDIEIMVQRFSQGAHTILSAQRRMGKTSLMKELQERLEQEYICLFIDLQKASVPEDAITDISMAVKPHKTVWQKVKGIFSNIFDAAGSRIEELNISELGIKLRAGLTSSNWQEKGEELFNILAQAEKPVILMIDEVPLMIKRMLWGNDDVITAENINKVDQFMSWLRNNSLKHQGKIRIVLSGSIGLAPVLHRARLTATINNFLSYDLQPWERDTALGCLNALANEDGIRFIDQAETVVIEKIGYCVPYHVQLFYQHIYEYSLRRNTKEIHPDHIASIYDNEMLAIRGPELSHYEERLKMALSREAYPLALETLTEAAVVGTLSPEAFRVLQQEYQLEDPTETQAITQETLRILEHDGYLRKTAKGYVFASSLLKDWWAGKNGFSYIPALQRKA